MKDIISNIVFEGMRERERVEREGERKEERVRYEKIKKLEGQLNRDSFSSFVVDRQVYVFSYFV